MISTVPAVDFITTYTCSTNSRDELRHDQCASAGSFIAFVDAPSTGAGVWEQRVATRHFSSARRNARMHKILSHHYINSEYSIWMDANVALRVSSRQLIDSCLEHSDIAVFAHRSRSCTYEEAKRCIELGLDKRSVIDEQMARYRRSGLPEGGGLAETTVVIRRNTSQVKQFNECWWSEVCRYSVRDQLSFMYVAHLLGTKISFIRPTKYENPFFCITNRPAGAELPQRTIGEGLSFKYK